MDRIHSIMQGNTFLGQSRNLVDHKNQTLDNGGKHNVTDLAFMVVHFCLAIPIIVGNGLVIRTLAQYDHLHNSVYILIGSLAIADLLVGIVIIPAFTVVHHAKLGLATKRNSCLASYVLSHCPTGVTLLTLLLIAIERFVAVHCPFLYHRVFTKWNTGIMATSIWIYTWILLPVLWFSTNHWHSGMKECNFADLSSEIYIAIVCGHLLTVFLIAAALQGTIAYTAWKHRCKIRIQARLVNVHTRVQQDAKIARMLAVVSGIFYFCWVPCLFALPFKLWNPGGTSSFWFYVWEQIGGVILESNSFMNPIIYACYDKELRQCFRNVLFRRSDYPYQSVRSERRQNTQDEHLKTTKL